MERYPLRPLILYGEHELTIDDKNRLLVPAEVRKLMNSERDGDAFFLVIGVNRKPWFYPEKYYETMVAQVPSEITPTSVLLSRDQLLFGMASRLEWDKQGRVLMPDKTLKRTGLGRDVTLIGVRDHLELWNRADWEVRREELIAQQA